MLVPSKIIKSYPNNKPWMSANLKELIVDKHRAFSKNSENKYDIQRETNSAIDTAKTQYKQKICSQVTG